MSRYFLYIQYKGTNYHGWQKQPNATSIQEEIEKALTTIFQVNVAIMGAGRTDTGVHASCMMAHFNFDQEFDIDQVMFKLNNILNRSISISKIKRVKHDFHARFDAQSRTYVYNIHQHKNPFLSETSYYFSRNINLKLMNEAAGLLLGEKDFSCFSKSNTQTFTNNCEIEFAYWEATENGVCFRIRANRFLRNMVRAIVGTLLEVGEGKRTVSSITDLIDSKNRSNAGFSVPASGLFLVDIEYPEDGFIE